MYESLPLKCFQNEMFRVHKTDFFYKSKIISDVLKHTIGSVRRVTIRKRRNMNFIRNVNLEYYIILNCCTYFNATIVCSNSLYTFKFNFYRSVHPNFAYRRWPLCRYGSLAD